MNKHRILSYKNILLLGTSFITIMLFSNFLIKSLCKKINIPNCPNYWPISVFWLRIPTWKHLLVAAIVLFIFFLTVRYLSKIKYKITYVIFFGIILVIGTNLIQGWRMGFVIPITTGGETGIQYYHDAIKIKDPLFFLSHFNQVQPKLLCHSRAHPPGAVLLIYLLLKLLVSPGLISIFISIVSTSLSVFFLYRILSTEFEEATSKYTTFLFILIPSIQIYYAATIDALIASLLLSALYFFIHPKTYISILGSVISLFLTSFLTFAFLFALPIMLGFEIIRKKRIFRSECVLLIIMFIYIIIYKFSHFNYIRSFITASRLENPHGFRLLAEPVYYLFTRLTDIYEIILFFGPFLSILALCGIRIMKKTNSDLATITWLGIATLSAMFFTGAFRAGETARICLFIYPYLIFPIASYLQDIQTSLHEKNVLLFLVFIQTVTMQMFGFYAW